MIAPPIESSMPDADVEGLLRKELKQNTLKTAVKNIVAEYGLNKNEVYEMALRIKNE